MNIILLEKIKKLGNIGDEVTVKSGYARNFLVPNNKALYATPENRKYFEEKKTEIKSQNENLIKKAKEKLKKLSEQEVILIRAASDTGQLFGSVSTKDIICVRQKSLQHPVVLETTEKAPREVPDYIEFDKQKIVGRLIRIPKLSDVPYPVQMEPNLVVEFYSR